MWEDCPSSRVRQGLLPRGETPHSADHRARYPGLMVMDGGDWGRTKLVNMMHGWVGERCD